VADRIDQPDARRGFILDGFPRTVAQAEALELMLRDKGLALDAVVELKVDDRILLDRIRQRAAESAGRVRADDTPEALEKRLKVYHAQTAPLVAFYRDKGLLRSVDGMASVDEVARQIEQALRPAAAGGC
ncbi:MAG: nucleoside monophosphate kinase, partial [Pseudomonadota bacterium]|nr:nucleoside monophosphate kinase [Pseudomonadota bacterium]